MGKLLSFIIGMASAMILTSVFDRTAQAFLDPNIRYIVNEGGTWSSKTISSLQVLDTFCAGHRSKILCSVVSESFPHLRIGAMRDYQTILGDRFSEDRWSAMEHMYSYPGGAEIEFFSADQPGKAHGPRRDILFLNEAINIPRPICDQLVMRTRMKILIDHNPCEEYWVHELRGRPDVAWIHSTYKDALEVTPADVRADIERREKTDPNWWNVYGLGLVGNVVGLVHALFSQIERLPEGGIEFYGLDYGYTNDPTCLTRNVIIGEDLFSDELIYEKGLDNNQIAHRMESLGVRKGYDEIFCDAAEPKSRDEIAGYGFNIKSCPKGPDSVRARIQLVNQYHQHWTKRSVNCIKEQRNYRYIADKNGNPTNKPIDNWNHGMDSRGYGVAGKLDNSKTGVLYVYSGESEQPGQESA
jgi:phage terminase large subunit